jgi:hypothetical protein
LFFVSANKHLQKSKKSQMLSIGKPLMMKLTSTLLIIVLNYLELVTGENADFIGIRSFGGDGGMSAVGVAIYSSDQSILVYGQMSLNFIAPFTCPQLAGTTAGGIDLYLARFRSNGTMLWCIRFGSTNNDFAMMSENSKASPMIESGTGDIVIAGIITGLTGISNSPNAAGRIFDQSCPAGNNFCTLISRFSSSGGHLRSRVFGTNTRVAGVRLVPNSESLIVVGSTFGSMLGANGPGGWDFYVMRMTMTKSNNEWTISNSPPVIWGSTNEELALAMDFDPVNKIVYVAGRCRGPFDGAARAVGDLDIFITRFRESGTESFQSLGTLIFGSVAFDLVRDILFDASSGALYICGTFGTSAVIDGLPVQLANTGRQQFLYKRFFNGTDGWIKTYGGFGNDDQASSLSIQPGTGNIVLSGFLNGQMAYTLADIPQPYYGNYDVSVFVLNPRDGSIILFRTAGTTASDSVSDTYFLPDNKTLAMAGRWANFAGYYLIGKFHGLFI